MKAGGEARADQHEVWEQVAQRLHAHRVNSASRALSDAYCAKRPQLDELRSAIRAVPCQVGAVVQIAGRPVALDMVRRSEVFAQLLPRLADGYGLAVGGEAKPPNPRAAEGFLGAALESRRGWQGTPGMGDAFALARPGIEGAGLTAEGELVALSAFPSDSPTS